MSIVSEKIGETIQNRVRNRTDRRFIQPSLILSAMGALKVENTGIDPNTPPIPKVAAIPMINARTLITDDEDSSVPRLLMIGQRIPEMGRAKI